MFSRKFSCNNCAIIDGKIYRFTYDKIRNEYKLQIYEDLEDRLYLLVNTYEFTTGTTESEKTVIFVHENQIYDNFRPIDHYDYWGIEFKKNVMYYHDGLYYGVVLPDIIGPNGNGTSCITKIGANLFHFPYSMESDKFSKSFTVLPPLFEGFNPADIAPQKFSTKYYPIFDSSTDENKSILYTLLLIQKKFRRIFNKYLIYYIYSLLIEVE